MYKKLFDLNIAIIFFMLPLLVVALLDMNISVS